MRRFAFVLVLIAACGKTYGEDTPDPSVETDAGQPISDASVDVGNVPPMPEGGADAEADGSPRPFLHVFATRALFPANLNLGTADGGLGSSICNDAARAAGIGVPHFLLMIVRDGGASPFELLPEGDGWMNMIGQQVFVGRPTESATLLAPILDESGVLITDTAGVWTGYGGPGGEPINCSDWTATTEVGVVGDPGMALKWWSNASKPCTNLSSHLYCFETKP